MPNKDDPWKLPLGAFKRRRGAKTYNGHAAMPGTGPLGETCKTCKWLSGRQGGRKTFYKCALMRHKWSMTPATDIRLSDLACNRWEEQ